MGDVFWSLLVGRGLLVTLPALFFGAAMWFLSHLWGAETDRAAVDRARIARFLEDDTPAATYRRLMGWALGRIDAALSGREGARGMGPGQVAFSAGLLQGTMLLAVVYPLLALGLQWVWGSPMRLGAVELAPAGDGLARGLVAVWLG